MGQGIGIKASDGPTWQSATTAGPLWLIWHRGEKRGEKIECKSIASSVETEIERTKCCHSLFSSVAIFHFSLLVTHSGKHVRIVLAVTNWNLLVTKASLSMISGAGGCEPGARTCEWCATNCLQRCLHVSARCALICIVVRIKGQSIKGKLPRRQSKVHILNRQCGHSFRLALLNGNIYSNCMTPRHSSDCASSAYTNAFLSKHFYTNNLQQIISMWSITKVNSVQFRRQLKVPFSIVAEWLPNLIIGSSPNYWRMF